MESVSLDPSSEKYPTLLHSPIYVNIGDKISAVGDLNILSELKIALFSSSHCPGEILLQTYDLAQTLRRFGVTVIGGFHAPMERHAFDILLKSLNSVIYCPARSLLKMRIPRDLKEPLQQKRLLILSCFNDSQNRATEQTAIKRNRFAAALADAVFITHARPGSKLENLAEEVVSWKKPVYSLETKFNRNLFERGAELIHIRQANEWLPAWLQSES